jgi:hypothetical protein
MQQLQQPDTQPELDKSATETLETQASAPEPGASQANTETTPGEDADALQPFSTAERSGDDLQTTVPDASALPLADEAPAQDDVESPNIEKALKDTKAWATKLSQDNSLLRQALDAALMIDPPTMMSDPEVGKRLESARGCLEKHSEFGPVIDLLDTVIRSVANYEREVGRQALTFAVLSEHPDAMELRQDPDFHLWAQSQPPLVKKCLCESTQPDDISWALDLFKKQRQAESTTNARELEHALRFERMRHSASPSPQTSTAPGESAWTREAIERMSLEEYRQNEAEIDQALARGDIR